MENVPLSGVQKALIAKYAAVNGIVAPLGTNAASKLHIAHCKISTRIDELFFNNH